MKDMAAQAKCNSIESLLQENRIPEMLTQLDHELSQAPDNVLLLNLKAIALYQNGDPRESLHTISRAKDQLAEHPTVLSNLSYILLSLGFFQEGWKNYETRLQNPDQNFVIKNAQMWDGKPTESLLLLPEQGFGDMIQFLRFMPLLAPYAKKLILACPAELISLVNETFEPQGFEGFYEVKNASIPQNFEPNIPYVPFCSLPYHLKTDLMSIPASVPYLFAPPEKIEAWRPLIEPPCQRHPLFSPQPLRVGLAWSGRSTHSNNHNRSMEGSVLTPLSKIPNVAWVSLQKEKSTPLSSEFHALDLMDRSHDLVDTMAIIHHLDLVITVDTAIAHLAGAMGKPTWLMLPFAAEWRWMEKTLFNPWYPTMVLFRQHQLSDWSSVITQIEQQFSHLVSKELSWESQPPAQSPLGNHCFFSGKKAVLEGDPVLAEKLLTRAIGLHPNLAGAHNMLGIAYAYQKKIRAAANEFATAARLLPNYSSALMNFGMASMKMNIPQVGASFYEFRVSANTSNYIPPTPQRWHKTPLNGKTLAVYGEQGFGDYIQFSRFIPWIKPKAQAERVDLFVRPPLVRLLKTLKNVDQVFPWEGETAPISERDAYIEFMSVPHQLGGFPHDLLVPDIPYFTLPQAWKETHEGNRKPGMLNVGLTWRVSPTGSLAEDRSLVLHDLMPLFYLKGINWISLQVDEPEEAACMGLHLPNPPIQDFADTAGIISHLDLVISSDSSVAHLAAALDKPTWVMLAHSTPDWRWDSYASVSQWYPKMKIFMQPNTRKWDKVIQSLYGSLVSLQEERFLGPSSLQKECRVIGE